MAKFQNVKITEATEKQLRTFVTDFLGLDVTGNEKPAALRALIATAHDSDEIYVAQDAEPMVPFGDAPPLAAGAAALRVDAQATIKTGLAGGGIQGGVGRSDPRCKIMIPSAEVDGKTIDDDVQVGVNGTAFLIRRNETVDVPLRVWLALKNAIRTSINHNPSTGEETRRDVPAYPVQTLERPTDAVIEAWEASIAAQFCPA